MSQADMSILEFLDISNFDFNFMGALTQRPGSTFLNSGLTGPALSSTMVFSQVLLNGASVFGGGGTYTFSTFSITSGATIIGPQVSSIFEFSDLQGQSYILFSAQGGFNYGSSFPIGSSPDQGATLFSFNQLFYCTGSTFNYLLDPLSKVINPDDAPQNSLWSFKSFVNRVFMCNGDHFYKWSGNTGTISYSEVTGSSNVLECFSTISNSVYKYCLPPGTSLFAAPQYNRFYMTMGLNGYTFSSATYTYSYAFINDRGCIGPVSSPVTVALSLALNTTGLANFTIGLNSVILSGFTFTGSSMYFNFQGFSCPDGYGIGATTITQYSGITTLGPPPGFSIITGQSLYNSSVAVFRDNGPGTGRYLIGYAGQIVPYYSGSDIFQDLGYPTQTTPEPTCIFATLAPQFLEVYNNQLFACGFSQAPSTVQFSDIGEPESVQPENNFDVRTNDGDFLTGLKTAFSQLFFFKNNSFHVLQGTDPTNFQLSMISDQYGCISNRAVAAYQNYLVFLDKKGIAQYNGAQVFIMSSNIDPLFAQMNIAAAQNNAWMVHNKDRNQVWCGIPVNGSTQINRIIVLDYLLNAWTHFDGLNIPCAAMAFGILQKATPYFGGYSIYVGYFGSSLTADVNGQTIILNAQTRFISTDGQSVEKMWRRLFMNVLSSQGATSLWNIALYANYASNPSMTFIQGGQSVQSRSDFGVSAKTLSIQFTTATNTDILQLTGLTIESRFQRNQ